MEYPNNDFNAYVHHVYDEYKLQKTSNFLLKVIKILPVLIWRTLKDAFIELLFLVLFWVVLAKMSQGRDLVVSLFEPDGIYGYKRIIFTTLAVLSLSLSMWIIPAFMFHQREKRSLTSGKLQHPFHNHLFFMHRVLPLVPFWLMASVLFSKYGTVFVLASIAELILLYFFNRWVISERKRRWALVSVAMLFLLSSVYFFMIFHKEYTAAKTVLAINLYLLSILMYLIYHEADSRILRAHARGEDHHLSLIAKYHINSIIYFSLLAIHIAAVLLIYYMPFHFTIAPESMLLYMFSVYVFAIDLFFYIVNVSRKRQLVAAAACMLLAVFILTPKWQLNTSHYAMDKNLEKTIFEKFSRDDFAKRYEALTAAIRDNKSSQPYPIILVSGEGGGSRAGLWFSQNLINYDFDTKGTFRNHIFSISTVSGSSIGLSTYFTYLENTRNVDMIDGKWVNFPAAVYENNFVGSSIRGLLLTDLYKSLVPGNWIKDRNSTLQNEEASYTERAILKVNKDADWNGKEIPDSAMTLKKDFMSFFYEKNGSGFEYRKNTPIVLINTCRSNDGRRGIFSSIKLDAIHFNEAIDVAGYLYEDSICDINGVTQCYGRKMPVSLGQACNTSELFPLFSAPAYVKKLGSFVDGGYHENSGLKSTLDIYQQLKLRLEKDPALQGKYKIYILYLKNGSGDKQLYKELESESVLLQPLNALFNQPFEGSASYFEERARVLSAIDDNTEFIPIKLNPKKLVDTSLLVATGANLKNTSEPEMRRKQLEPEILPDLINDIVTDTTRRDIVTGEFIKDTILRFPLARWLSKTVIDRIQMCAKREHRGSLLQQLIGQVNAVNTTSTPPAKPQENFSIHKEIKKEMEEDTSYKRKIRNAYLIN
ncbi:hypothetical protein [Longitalea arenae]|uniref:hypothetical protein n=1 Tax=Longitalea arenae TaxID=2812558 RepID=UPI001967A98A|nr:hypothetical protein [Longitalea arenae]